MQKNITSLSALNWDDLKFFLEVARTRKASSAAKRLAVDYTTVSRRISSLEAALGTLLFEKSRTNGFTLTSEGRILYSYADKAISLISAAESNGDRSVPMLQPKLASTARTLGPRAARQPSLLPRPRPFLRR